MTRSRPGQKLLAVAARWALPLAALTLVGAYAGSQLEESRSTTYSAEAVLVVPPILESDTAPEEVGGERQVSLGSPNEARALASTYAGAMPDSRALRDAISGATGVDPGTLRRNLDASVDDDTSNIRLEYTAATEQEVLGVLNAATNVLVGPTPPAPISPGTLILNATAEEAEAETITGGTSRGTGALLGLLAGLLLLWVVERSDRRADRTGDLRTVVGCPVTEWRRPTPALAASLLDRWGATGRDGLSLTLLGVGRTSRAQLAGVERVLRAGAAGRTLSIQAVRASSVERDAAVHGSDVTVLVVRRGTRLTTVDSALNDLGQLGRQPTWALLASPGASRTQVPEPETGVRSEDEVVAAR